MEGFIVNLLDVITALQTHKKCLPLPFLSLRRLSPMGFSSCGAQALERAGSVLALHRLCSYDLGA